MAALVVAAMAVQPGLTLAQVPLDPLTLTKYVDPLPLLGVMQPVSGNSYEVGMYEVTQKLHSQLPPTRVWAYGTSPATATYPGATFETRRGTPIHVRWTNNLPYTHLLDYAIDPTIHMAMWESGVPVVVHLHGAEDEPQSDGGPEGWFTQSFAEKGADWKQEIYNYSNEQLPATLWYHDHVLGLLRLNVYAGLAGIYLLRDPGIEERLNLPSGPYEIPLMIQDRSFTTDGQLLYPVGGDNPEIHPLWQPEFFGNTILVNGMVWPYLNVEPRKYRFRIVNASNARFYSMRLYNDASGKPGPGFWQIGSDGGYLDRPVLLADPKKKNARRLVMGPGERCDIVIDFSAYESGTTFTLQNDANSPFPGGDPVDPQTTGQIMQFRVVRRTSRDRSSIATPGDGYVTRLEGADVTRQLTLNEVEGPNGPIAGLLDGKHWQDETTELPQVGQTEVWKIINTTEDAHPIHIHLGQFQLVSRQKFNKKMYMRVYEGSNGSTPDVTPYLTGRARSPEPEEAGWKDTFKMFPGEVTTIRLRFAPQDNSPAFQFDATAEPGYVWHCHILEHEDNEMMRRYKLHAPVLAMTAMSRGSQPAGGGAPGLGLSVRPGGGSAAARLAFSLPQPGKALLRVYAVDGRLVRTVTDGTYPAGTHEIGWDGTNTNGVRMPSGVYFVQLEANRERQSKRLVLVK